MDSSSEVYIHRWRAGLQQKSARDLSIDERNILRNRQKKRMGEGILGILFGIVCFVVSPAMDTTDTNILHSLLSLGFFIAACMLFVYGRNKLIHSFWYKKDCAAARAEIYVGDISSNPKDKTARKLIREGILYPLPDHQQEVEFLYPSGCVWKANGVLVNRRIMAPLMETAAEPPYASIAAEWVEPLDTLNPKAAYVNMRKMSSYERIELQKHLNSVIRLPLIYAGLTNAASIAILFGFAPLSILSNSMIPWMIFGLAIIWNINLLLRIYSVASIIKDLKSGVLVIARTPKDTSHELPDDIQLSPPSEFLPISRILWSQNGTPAAWRISSAV
jgi:hypothetical protein